MVGGFPEICEKFWMGQIPAAVLLEVIQDRKVR